VPAEGTAVTCLTLPRPSVAAAEVVAGLRAHLPDGDAPSAQLARFALAGGLATSLQVLLFTLLAPGSALLAQVVSWGASTALANELHRRRTFRAGDRVTPLAAQLEGGGLAVLGLLVTSAALTVLATAAPDAGVGGQLLLVLSVTVAVGLGRFVALRWSFVVRRVRPA
jgi:putative flippase GtrA